MEKLLSRNWLYCGLIGLFATLLWQQTIAYQFVWDDANYISQNKALRSLKNIPGFFYKKEFQAAQNPNVSYRPLRNTLYSLLYALDRQRIPEPAIFHLANVLGHAIVAMLLFLVALLLLKRRSAYGDAAARIASLLVALGFAAHPVNSEVVCWAKSLDDIMAAAFVLASARALLQWNPGGHGYMAALLWFLLAVFAKESAAPFAAVTFFIFYGFHQLPRKQCLRLTLPFLGVALLFAVCQHLVMGQSSQCPPLAGSYGQTLINMFPVIVDYIRLLWGIPPFCADYNFMVGEAPHSFFSVSVLNGLILLIGFGCLAVCLWRRSRWRMFSFGLIWLGLFMLPVSNLVPMMQYMAERFLYLPMMGFLLVLAGLGLAMLPAVRRLALVTALGLVVVWSAASLNRMTVWRDELTLYLRTALDHPGIRRVEKNGALAIFNLPEMAVWRTAAVLPEAEAERVIATLQDARRILPNSDLLTAQLGLVEARMGHWPDAIWNLEKATRQNPRSSEWRYDLASAYHLTGQIEKARGACAEALRLNPGNKQALQLQQKLNSAH